MKNFTKKGIVQKIVIVIIFVISFNFIIPNVSFADEPESGVNGALFDPIEDLLLNVTDVVVWLMNKTIYDMDESFVDIYYKEYEYIDKNEPYLIQWTQKFMHIVEKTGQWLENAFFLLDGQYMPTSNSLPKHVKLPMFVISPEEIFKDEVPLLKVNFFNPEEETTTKSSATQLQPVISKWYYALRNFAIVMLLSILVYIGIRIIISSSSEDKAKYKQHLLDWLIALCLLFFMHYIMSFAVTVNERIIDAVKPMSSPYKYVIRNANYNDQRKLEDYYFSNGESVLGDSELAKEIRNSGDSIAWPTNLMGKARLDLQMELDNYSNEQKLMKSFSLTVIYMGLVMYTVLFLFRYLKRLLMLTFLTMIAPLMAMTYPLDKMHDNKSQAFNMWLKEYIFNLLIQPVHLILYTILIGTALEFAAKNILYSLVAFGFMLQAEKIMKSLFGFGVANTVSNTSAALGGALAMKGVDMLSKHLGGSKKGAKKEDDKQVSQPNRKPTRNVNDLINSVLGGSVGTLESTFRTKEPTDESSEDDSSSNFNRNFETNETAENNNAQANNIQANLTQEASRQAQFIAEEQEKSRERIASSNLRTIANRVNNSKVGKHTKYIGTKAVKGLAKGALKAGLMTAGATVGLTAGLVSDDFSNVAKYGLAGAGAGWIAGKGIPNKLSSMKEGISKAYEEEYKATHTKAEINERLDRKVLDDKERIKKYQEEFGVDKQGAQNIMREIAQQYRDYGVTDDDMIIKAIKTDGINDAEKIMVAKMASQVGGDEEKYKNLKQGLEDRGIATSIANKYLQIIRGFNNWV